MIKGKNRAFGRGVCEAAWVLVKEVASGWVVQDGWRWEGSAFKVKGPGSACCS